jgi:hypothetical protein
MVPILLTIASFSFLLYIVELLAAAAGLMTIEIDGIQMKGPDLAPDMKTG